MIFLTCLIEFFIDLTNIGMGSKETADKTELVTKFERLINGQLEVPQELIEMVPISTRDQYKQGL